MHDRFFNNLNNNFYSLNMRNNNSKQLYITSFDYPLNSITTLFFKRQTFDLLYKKKDYNIKMFIGSDWSIIGSGFQFNGPNNLIMVFTISGIVKDDFEYISKYLVTHINSQKIDKNIELVVSFFSNTYNNTTVIEYRLEYEKESDCDYIFKLINISIIQEILSKFCFEAKALFKAFTNENLNNTESLKINHSFLIQKSYKEAFNFFYNWKNISKSLKTEDIWEIKEDNNPNENSNYKNFSIYINKNINIHYKVVSIKEDKNKIEIIYDKTSNSFPALNAFIKMEFINLSNNSCIFMYETGLPININSSLFNSISSYLYYCNNKSKIYIEKSSKNI